MWRAGALVAGASVLGIALAGCYPTSDVGYVEIKTVPVAPLTQTALYIGGTELAPIRRGTALLRQQVGTFTLQAAGYTPGTLAPLCDVVVQKNRITTVTISVLERPPRCQCRATSTDEAATGHACVS